MTLVLMADARPEPMPLLPCRPQDFTDPTRTRCRFELREGEHHIVKKSRALGTRIGFGSVPDPNTYWNFSP
ncbi:hypothetical protein ABMA28_003617 [Loxostege sticticalis]|uniref:Uncharacterized protein n=1 Tax=Loxostege sticticalis TaxID=481309 RepID=A0ABD0SX04_LOXSC